MNRVNLHQLLICLFYLFFSSVKYTDVFHAECGDTAGTYTVTVHYANKAKHPVWTHGKLELKSADQAACNTVVKRIKEEIEAIGRNGDITK